jgi:hypothetical protein
MRKIEFAELLGEPVAEGNGVQLTGRCYRGPIRYVARRAAITFRAVQDVRDDAKSLSSLICGRGRCSAGSTNCSRVVVGEDGLFVDGNRVSSSR